MVVAPSKVAWNQPKKSSQEDDGRLVELENNGMRLGIKDSFCTNEQRVGAKGGTTEDCVEKCLKEHEVNFCGRLTM